MSRYPNHLTYKGCDFKSRIENLELVYTYQEKKRVIPQYLPLLYRL